MSRRSMAALVAALSLTSTLSGCAASASAPSPGATRPAAASTWQDEMIYMIVLDRFCNGDKTNDLGANPGDPRVWHGGDVAGVIEKLGYIKELGFTAIWITPHVKQAGRGDYHGYHAVDFFQTDPHFGDNAEMKELVEKAHAAGLKVLFDIVVNHTGNYSPLLKEHPDWFHPRKEIRNWNDRQEIRDGWIAGLPDFDQSNPEVRDYILAYSKFWIEETGVDGFRIDTVKHVPPEFFDWWTKELRKIKPDFWLIGEEWDNDPRLLAEYQDVGIDALIDFPVIDPARNVFAKDQAMSTLPAAAAQVEKTLTKLPALGAFLDGHDVQRFVNIANDDQVRRLRLGLVWLFTQRDIPILYYGTEVALPGGDDPDNRRDFPWDSLGNQDEDSVYDLVRRLTAIRRETGALRQGARVDLASGQWHYAFARTDGESQAVVVLNNQPDKPYAEAFDVTKAGLRDGTVLVDLLTESSVTVTAGKIAVAVPARSGAIFVPRLAKP